jgi:putative transposase
VIPPKANRRKPPPFDPQAYKMRNAIERAFCRLKNWRGIATRYDKRTANFLARVCIASAVTYWLQ